MKWSQILVVIGAVAAVAVLAFVAGGGDEDGDTGHLSSAPSGAVRIPFAYSPEKEKLLKPLIQRFNDRRVEVGGHPAFVEGQVVSSGEAETKIAKGGLQPVAWSPASSLWGRLLNFDADRPYAPAKNQSIVRTPLVIAMWEPMARALGYPRKQLGFADILALARSGRGWAAYGKPQFGAFKLVHTNPDFSTSGLSAVVAEYYAATGKKEGLVERDVTASRGRATVRDIERSIVHYGDTTLFIADQMRKAGPGYASAVAMEETTIVDFNQHRGGQPKLVAIYPKEGTFYSDSPLIVLDAPWVSPAERDGARAFGKFLADEVDAETAARSGFRPPTAGARPVAPISPANGADPDQPKRVLGLPEPRVLDTVRKTWRADRKPANVLLVVDTSGSMVEENRLERAKEGLDTFLRQLSPNDRVGLESFNEEIHPLVPIAPVRQNIGRLRSTIDSLIADGGTAFYDAAIQGFDDVRLLDDSERINAVVLLTDGEDTDSSATVDRAVARMAAQGDSDNAVRVFTIAYSASAEGAEAGLKRIAAASGGQEYTGDTEDIELVYRSISSFF
ncbi:MAG TPA: extracellular solute-binding protein [Thermoleophilaceae bacterium]|nr:extracellular solute-binding protein [Thermoleophilaceae bacterium]